MKQSNLLAKNPKRKFSAKQIAAQKRFAAMAKAGTLRKGKRKAKRNPKNHYHVIGDGNRYFETTSLRSAKSVFSKWKKDNYKPKLWRGLEQIAGEIKRNPVKAGARRPAKKRKAAKATYSIFNMSKQIIGGPYKTSQAAYNALRKVERKTGQAGFIDRADAFLHDPKKNPVKAGARRSPPKRNPTEKFMIRGQRPVKSGYLYYYLRGDQFVKETRYADKFSKAAGEKQMRAILPKLPAAIASITLVKA